MNKRLFHAGLFKEGLRQTRLIGLGGLVITVLFTSAQWLMVLINQLTSDTTYQELVSFTNVGYLLILQFCVFSPLMVLYLFRYLNRRDSSDFYHSIPHTRQTLHISFFCAVEFWNLLTTAALAASSLLLYGVFVRDSVLLNMATVGPFLFNMVAAQFLVAAAVLFAMSITGTSFTNVMVSLFIIFVPRVLITTATGMIESYCRVIDVVNLSPLLNPGCNVAAGLPIAVLSMDQATIERCLQNTGSGIYTLVLGVIYFAVALLLLNRRKSETAAKSSPSRFLQAVYRIVFGATLGLIPLNILLDAVMYQGVLDPGTMLGLVVIVLVIAIFYFLFELLATKKASNMLRAIPGLFIFLLIDGVIFAGILGISKGVMAYRPQADQIDGVSITMNNKNYFAANASSVEFEDDQVKVLAAEGLQTTLEGVEKRQIERYENELYNHNGGYTVQFAFRENNKVRRRYVLLSDEDYRKLVTHIGEKQAYRTIFYQLPKIDGSSVIDVQQGIGGENPNLTPVQKQALYDTFVKEVTAMSFEQWYPLASSCQDDNGYAVANLRIETAIGQKNYVLHFAVDDQFPKTKAAFLKLYQSCMGEEIAQKLGGLVKKVAGGDKLYEDYSLDVELLDLYDQYMDIDSNEKVQQLLKYLKKIPAFSGEEGEHCMVLRYSNSNNPEDWFCIMVPADQQALAPLLESYDESD